MHSFANARCIIAFYLLRCHRCTPSPSHTHSYLVLSSCSYDLNSIGYFTNIFVKSVHPRLFSFSIIFFIIFVYVQAIVLLISFSFFSVGWIVILRKKKKIPLFMYCIMNYVLCNHPWFSFAWCTRRSLDTLMIVLLSVGFRVIRESTRLFGALLRSRYRETSQSH